MAEAILLTLLGLILLLAGAELVVRGAIKTAELLRAPAILVGLTVVAWGTSAPEIAVSVNAAANDFPAVAVGNVIGSNILNILLILGLGALILPLTVNERFVRRDIPVLLAVTVGAWFLLSDGSLNTTDGFILLIGLVAYTGSLYLNARKTRTVDDLLQEKSPEPVSAGAVVYAAGSLLVGITALTFGSRYFTNGAVEVAMWAGVSERVIAVTVVSIGTSLPEVAASVMASIRRQPDLAVGNVIGSNLFNLLAILGLSGVAGGQLVLPETMVGPDMAMVLGAAVLVLPLAVSGMTITRLEGVLLLVLALGYLLWLLLGTEGVAWPAWAFLGASAVFTAISLAVHAVRGRGSSTT